MSGAAERRREAALKARGLRALAAGDAPVAQEAFEAAALLEPGDPEVAFHLGNLALERNLAAEAAAHYRRALQSAPGVTAIHNNLATALLQLDDAEGAIEVARQGLEGEPGHAALRNALGNALVRVGRLHDAAEQYALAAKADGRFTSALVNLGNGMRDVGQPETARQYYMQALRQVGVSADALVGLAGLAEAEGRHDEAIQSYRQALDAEPRHIAARNNLAIALMVEARWAEALTILRELVHDHPETPEVFANLGQVLQGLGRHDEAVRAFDRALALKPGDAAVPPFLMQSLRYQCDWRRLETIEARVLADLEGRLEAGETVATPPFTLAATAASPALRLRLARAYAERCLGDVGRLAPAPEGTGPRRRRKKLRVGFLSPDLRQHSVGLVLRDLVAAFDRERFQWFSTTSSGRPAACRIEAPVRAAWASPARLITGTPLQSASRVVTPPAW